MSEIKVNSVVNSTGDNDSGLDLSTNDQVIIKTANTTAMTIDSSQNVTFANRLNTSNLGTGGVLQVKQTAKTDVFTTADNTFVDVTGLTVDITPKLATSTIMVEVHIGTHNASSATSVMYNLRRGSSNIGTSTIGSGDNCSFAGTIDGNRGENVSMKFLDDPQTTSTLTYGLQVKAQDAGDIFINQRTGVYSTISTITVTEIGV